VNREIIGVMNIVRCIQHLRLPWDVVDISFRYHSTILPTQNCLIFGMGRHNPNLNLLCQAVYLYYRSPDPFMAALLTYHPARTSHLMRIASDKGVLDRSTSEYLSSNMFMHGFNALHTLDKTNRSILDATNFISLSPRHGGRLWLALTMTTRGPLDQS
jgi:hypothetical protein